MHYFVRNIQKVKFYSTQSLYKMSPGHKIRKKRVNLFKDSELTLHIKENFDHHQRNGMP